MGRLLLAAVAAVLACLLAAPAALAAPQVTIRRDAQGTPHVLARDWEGLGYGFARAHAEDAMCVLADVYLTTDGERSRFFGAEKTYPIRNTNTTPNNLNSDFFWAKVIKDRRVEKLVEERPPSGPLPQVKAVVKGYVAGYNDQLAAMGGAAGIKDPACKGEPWVRPIDEWDVWRRFFQLSELASAMAALDGLGSAQPPTPPVMGGPSARDAAAALAPGEVDRRLHEKGVGSNAIALGRGATQNGKGLLLGNPHQPWLGAERFYQSHLTIPGVIDVAGGSLFGSPAINIGYTRDLAWSHTVSTARRFAIYEEKLVPGSPTTYLVDGKPREMERTTVTVKARRADGSLEDRSRTLYETIHGPVTTSLVGLPLFPWREDSAFTQVDSNRANLGRLLNHFFETNQANSVAELRGILRRYLGIPWVNTIAADREGAALYADIGSVPGVPDKKLADCSTALGSALDRAQRVQVLDGSRSACDPDTAKSAPGERILPAEAQPELEREDYVTNSNDSYWLSNPRQPLTGFPRIIGEERTVRTLRTRLGIRMVEEELAGGGRFSAEELRALMFNDRQHAWELWKDELLAMCPQVTTPAACAALRQYPGRDDLDARGAHLFRRFVARAITATPSPYRVPFDPNDPVNTPRGLNTENPQVREALPAAVRDLQEAKIPLDAPLGDFQFDEQHGERIPMHGGPQNLGLFNHLGVQWDPKRGWQDVREGATYVQTVSFTDDKACPIDAQTVLGHGLSTDSGSRWYSNGTKLLGQKRWTPQAFCQADVRRAAKVTAEFGGGAEGRRRAALLRQVSVRRRSARALRITFRLGERARVTVRVKRGRKVARRAVRTRGAGRRVIVLGKLRPGRYRVQIRASGDGRTQTVTRAVRVR